MDPDELLRIELRFEVGHRVPNQMRLFADVQAHIIARGFTPVDVGGADEVDAAAGLDDQPIDAGLAAADFRNQGEQLPAEAGRLPLRELVAGVRERRLEALGTEGLEQVVERVDLEGAQRVLVE